MWLRTNPKIYRFLLPYLPYTKRYAILKKLKTLYNHSCILDATFGNFKDYKESILIKK